MTRRTFPYTHESYVDYTSPEPTRPGDVRPNAATFMADLECGQSIISLVNPDDPEGMHWYCFDPEFRLETGTRFVKVKDSEWPGTCKWLAVSGEHA